MSRCIVCGGRAVVFCQSACQASLCDRCDTTVHANQAATQHHRVHIQPGSLMGADGPADSGERSSPLADSLDDINAFAVPDVDTMTSVGHDEHSPFVGKSVMGKEFMSDEFELGDFDVSWLDKLAADSGGLDKIPSGVLDSLVPEEAALDAPLQAQPQQQQLHMRPAAAASRAADPYAGNRTGHREGSIPMHMPVPDMYMQPGMQWVSYQQAAQFPMQQMSQVPQHVMPAQPLPQQRMSAHGPQQTEYKSMPAASPRSASHALSKSEAPVTEMAIDIDTYVPRSLLPMDPLQRAQLLQSRKTKLERFREKKRRRLFKKTIRYASRKAYAEVRPRIKGRFARKDEVAAMRANGTLPVA